jgi:uncharacterized FlaG/YvyC family protein
MTISGIPAEWPWSLGNGAVEQVVSAAAPVAGREPATPQMHARAIAGPSDAGEANSTSSGPGDHDASPAGTADALQKLIERLNAELSPSREVHFDAGAPVGQVWLNVIDQRTGEVIERIPPERVRELAAADGQASAYQGLAVDKRV